MVSYISIDMNNATAEIAAIEYLWDKLAFGGVVVLDDYAYAPEFLNQKHAWEAFAISRGFDILTLPTVQGLIIKNKSWFARFPTYIRFPRTTIFIIADISYEFW